METKISGECLNWGVLTVIEETGRVLECERSQSQQCAVGSFPDFNKNPLIKEYALTYTKDPYLGIRVYSTYSIP